MFKALVGGNRSSSDVRSTTSSNSKGLVRRKSDSKSSHSRKSSRGDDRDRALDDSSPYPPSLSVSNRRSPPSIASDSVTSTYVTAEPDQFDNPIIVERTPKRRNSDRESQNPRRERDRSESRDQGKRSSRRNTTDGLNEGEQDRDNDRDRRERRRTQSRDFSVRPSSTSRAPNVSFAADVPAHAPGDSSTHGSSSQYDPHVQQQFPGQFPALSSEPYFPPNSHVGAAADYYGDQGESVADQPGVRPQKPAVIPSSQLHLMTASPSANPPPEPSSMGQVGAAASYFDESFQVPPPQARPPTSSSSNPPKPATSIKPTKPDRIPSSSVHPAAASGAAAYGVSSGMSSFEQSNYSHTAAQHSYSYSATGAGSTNKPHQFHGVGAGVGMAAAGAAAGYMLGHQHHSSNPENSANYAFQNYEGSSQASLPPYDPRIHTPMATGAGGPATYATYNPGYYPRPPGGALAMSHRHRGPLSRFVDFWRDPEGVGRFEDYTETIGVCRECFEPGTTSMNAPRRHHYHRRRRSSDLISNHSASRVNKLSRYHSSEDESRRRKSSRKSSSFKQSSSWLPGMLGGALFAGKEFHDSYSVRSGRVAEDRRSTYDVEHSDSDHKSYTSRGVIRRSEHSPRRDSDSKYSRRTRSRSRSTSRSGGRSFVKEAALGAAAAGAGALIVSKNSERSRSRSRSRKKHRKSSSSSSSFVENSRSATKSTGGFTSFFTSSSANRKKKQRAKKRRGFFSFSSSSSSSLDADLAFGSTISTSSKSRKKKGKKEEDVNAALLGLGATATALAASSHGHNRRTGELMIARDSRSRRTTQNSSWIREDEDWVDADSEDQSSSSISSGLAFGESSGGESGPDAGQGGWSWGWGGVKQKQKKKKSSATDTAMAVGAGALGAAALASVARHRDSRQDSRVSSSSGSLQHVIPAATSDPSRYEAIKMSPSVMSDQPPLVRPGPIPLQQPQPFTPVSQAVYSTQGTLPGSIPAYSAPFIQPISNQYNQYNISSEARNETWVHDNTTFVDRPKPSRRSNSSPILPDRDSYVSSLKQRSVAQASVSFDLTEEQAHRERVNRQRENSDAKEESTQMVLRKADEPARRDYEHQDLCHDHVQLIDRSEEEHARRESDRRELRRREEEDDEKRFREAKKEKDSPSTWADAAAVGAIGAAAASTLMSSSKADDDAEESSSRRNERRERRRAERRRQSEQGFESSITTESDVLKRRDDEVDMVEIKPKAGKENRSSRRTPLPAPVHDDYAEFYAPVELRHGVDEHKNHDFNGKPTIIEVVPSNERLERELAKSLPADLPQFGPEPYEDHDHLPWPVPRLNLIEPTPPHSVSGSALGYSPSLPPTIPMGPPAKTWEKHQTESESKRSSTGSRVSWGGNKTHEYDVPSSSEQEDNVSVLEAQKEFPISPFEEDKPKYVSSKPHFGSDIEFAATVAAGTAAAGFDPSVVINDPSYHTRTSPPGSEDEASFSPHSKWAPNTGNDFPTGFVEGEIGSYVPSEVEPTPEHVIQNKPFFTEPEPIIAKEGDSSYPRQHRGSIAQEVFEQLNAKQPRVDSPERDTYSMPGGFDTGVNSRELSQSRDDSRSTVSAPVLKEYEAFKSDENKRKESGSHDDFEIIQDSEFPPVELGIDEETERRRKHRSKRDSDISPVYDEAKSIVAEYVDDDKSERRKHRHHSMRNSETSLSDDAKSSTPHDFADEDKSGRRKHHRHHSSDNVSLSEDFKPSVDDYAEEDSERRKPHRRHRSRDSDSVSLYDDAKSAVSEPGDEDRSRRRKHHRRHSTRDDSVDDARSVATDYVDHERSERRKHHHRSRDSDSASINSSPARIDESKEKRHSKDKGSGGLLRNIFSSKVSLPDEHSRSHSLEKHSSRESISEAGTDEGRRRRKKHSSSRSSSRGDRLDKYGSDVEPDLQNTNLEDYSTNLEDYRSNRLEKEERRRHKYEEIVESGKHPEKSERSDYKNDYDKTFLAERPETSNAAEHDSYASGLEGWVEGAALATIGLGLAEELLQQRPRSVSASVPVTEKTLDLAPKSRSRPSSPEPTLEHDRQVDSRRQFLIRAVSDSPTAVPLHFRRPPTSPNLHLHRVSPVDQQSVETFDTPTQPRHRRPNSVEFVNSREFRPLWLVERHSSLAESQFAEPLPSLPSSKTSSRAPSVEDLRVVRDEDAVQSWEPFNLTRSAMGRRRSSGLVISTEQTNISDETADLLGSQQATPTAETYGETLHGSAKKEKLKYEFHSPSELLRDSETYPELPPSPTIESLPSPEGSVIGVTGPHDNGCAINLQPDITTPTQEAPSSAIGIPALGFGFAGIVDAAVINTMKDNEKPTHSEDKELQFDDQELTSPLTVPVDEIISTVPEPITGPTQMPGLFPDFANVVHAVVAAEASSPDKTIRGEVKGESSDLIGEEPFEIVDAEPAEQATKELILEHPTELKPEEQLPIDEPVEESTPSSSKKKNTKEGKTKDKSIENVDMAVATDPVATEEQTPVVGSAGGPRSIELEEASRGVVVVPEAEYIESPAELEPDDISTGALEPAETIGASDSQQDKVAESELVSTSAAAAGDKSVIILAAESEPEVPPSAPVESEQLEPTENMSKKAKRDKKKQKKRSKSISAVNEVADAQPSLDEAPAVEDQSQRDEDVSIPFESEVPTQTVDKEILQEGYVADAFVPAEGAFEPIEAAKPVLAETAIQSPAEDLVTPADDSPPIEAPISITREFELSQPSAEVTGQSEPFQDTTVPSKEPANTTEDVGTTSVGELPEEDVFQETVETQPVEAHKTDDPTSQPSDETVSPSGEYSDAHESQPQFSSEKATDVLEPATEETAAPEESMLVPPDNVEPVPSTEPLEPSTEISNQATPIVEPEVKAPLTAAQKKKAKKDKKKKSKTAPSISEDKSIESESQPAETQPVESNALEVIPSVETHSDEPAQAAPDTESLTTDATPFEQMKELELETEPHQAEPILTPGIETVSDSLAKSDDTELKEDEPSTQHESPSQVEEPQVPMTSAEKKKAKKLKKKLEQQKQQQENILGSTDEAQVTETSLAPEFEVLESAKDFQPATEREAIVTEDEPILPADSEVETQPVEAHETEDPSPLPLGETGESPESQPDFSSEQVKDAPEADTPTVEESAEPKTEVAPSEDIIPNSNLSETEKKDEIFETETPKEVEAGPVTTHEQEIPAEVTEIPKEEPESVPAEIPMTAAQKKKAKKEKKKQEKRQSMQPLEQAASVDSLEQYKSQIEGNLVVSEPLTPVELSHDTTADSPVEKAVVEEVPPSEAPINPDVDAGAKENEDKSQDTPAIDEISTVDPVDNDSVPTLESDLPNEATEPSLPQETSSESPPADTAASPETNDSKEILPAETECGLEADDQSTAAVELPLDAITPNEPSVGTEQPAEVELEATALSKKDKKKKKRQSLASEELQPESSEPVKEEPIEPSSADNSEAPASIESAETPVLVEVPQIPNDSVQEESPKEEPVPDSPTGDATKNDSQAVSKKKSKKDKKKRKSVAWDMEETPSTQTEDVPSEQKASESLKYIQDDTAGEVVPVEESTDNHLEVADPVPTAIDSSAAEPQTSTVDAKEIAGDISLDTAETGADSPDKDPLQSISNVEITEPEALLDKKLESESEAAPSTELSDLAPSTEIVPATEELSSSVAEPAEQSSDTGLSAKERRKLKKKEKKKSKPEEEISEPSTPANELQEIDSSAQSTVDIPETHDTQISQLPEATDAAIEEELSKPKDTADESPEKSFEFIQSDSNDPTGTVQTIEPIASINESNLTTAEDLTDVQNLGTSPTSAEPNLSPRDGGETEQPIDPEADTALSAKERRKAKKNKKRQSKNLDPGLSPITESDSAIPEAVAQKEETTALTEPDITDIPESIIAPSLAEEDGKEYLTHDTEMPNVQANELASTDEFVSSQVEQPVSESRSMDPPALEQKLEFDQFSEQKEEHGVPAALEDEELTNTEKEVGIEEVSDDNKIPADHILEASMKDDTQTAVAIDTDVQSGLKDEISEEPSTELPIDNVQNEAVVAEKLAAEEFNMPTSKSQKKKDKKKKKQQEQEIIMNENLPTPAPESLQPEEKEVSDPVPRKADFAAVAEPVEATEHEAPVYEHLSADHINESKDAPVNRVMEQAELSEEPKPLEFEQPEAPSLSRKLSKKEKKKKQQREALLVEQAAAEAEAKVEEHPVSEAVDPPAPVVMPKEFDLAPDQNENDQINDQAEPTIQAADEPNNDATRGLTDEMPLTSDFAPDELITEPLTEDVKATVEEIPAPLSSAPADTLPVEASVEQQGEAFAEPENEPPTLSRKMSKKEKKKAAAAAATAAQAAKEEKDTDLPSLDEPSVLVDEPSVLVDEPSVLVDEPSVLVDEPSVLVDEPSVLVDEPSVLVDEPSILVDSLADSSYDQTRSELQPERITRALDQPLEADSSFSENIAEQTVELSHPIESFEHEAKSEEVTEEPISTPVSRKLSKKESKKAKKQAQKEAVDLLLDERKDSQLPDVKKLESEVPDLEMAKEVVPESEPVVHETPVEFSATDQSADDIAAVTQEKEFQLDRELDPLSDAQPDSAPKLTEDPLPVIPALVAEYTEPEPSLSRKASKKKAKRAKEIQQPLENETFSLESAMHSVGDVPTKDFDISLPESKADEEFPVIDWNPRKSGNSINSAEFQEQLPVAEPVPIPATEAIDEFDESAIPSALKEAIEADEEKVFAPLSKKDKKKAKKNKRKSEQIGLVESDEALQELSHKKIELPMNVESPVRSTTPGGSKIANLFPGLERGGFRRSALDQQTPSLKDSAEEETVADLEANRDIAIPVLEAPLATTGSKEITEASHKLAEATKNRDNAENVFSTEESHEPEPELEKPRDHLQRFSSPPPKPSSKERGSMLFYSSPSTRHEEQSSPMPHLPSQLEPDHLNTGIGLRRAPSIIHGQHQHTPRTWNLEESAISAVRTPSPPRSIFGPYDDGTRPRTPLDPIAEGPVGIRSMAHYGSPRLEIKPEHVLPRPHTPVRKFTDNSMARQSWPTPENDELPTRSPSKTPEHGMPILRPTGSKGKLRRTNRSTSSDLRTASRSDSQPPPLLDLDQLPSSSSDKGKRALRNMSDVYEGWGETPSSPRSPSRPPSVRRRHSVQHLQELETRLDQLISENRLLTAARDEAEERMRKNSLARRKSDQALNVSDHDLRDKEAEVEQLKSSVDWLQKEMGRLTQENESLTASNSALAAAHASEVTHVRESSTRELDDLRLQHGELSTKIDERVRQEIESALAVKDAELRRLRVELEEARDKVKELQQQISASVNDNALVFRDEDYFDAACQKLCGHVQQWVLRFSKHSDHRRCRLLSELRDEKIADRFENALLDGSDADAYLSDRVRRRDVFMSVVMTMVWEYIFTRYLFGMDREQRQKLKSLEKHLGEVGARRAVQRWRATTLTLLSRRPAFASQRQSDTEAVTLEIFGTLSRILPPPSAVDAQLLESLRKVMRVAVILSLEMRTQMAEYIMLPPLQPEYDTNGDLARQVFFNASLMNERSGETNSNEELQTQQAVVRIVLFPLVVKKGNDFGEGDEEVVVCPAQVLIARPGKEQRLSRMTSGDRMSLDAGKSVHSLAPSVAPSIAPSSSMMDMSNVI